MFLSILFPIADLRPLLGVSALPAPSWKVEPNAGKEFVHFFGKVQKRQKGPGLKLWLDERFYAGARRALIYPTLEKQRLGPLRPPQGAFRGLFCSQTGVVARVEVGVSAAPDDEGAPDGRQCSTILRDFLGLRTQVAHLRRPADVAGDAKRRERGVIDTPLHLAGEHLARLYLHATTAVAGAVDTRLVEAGEPLVFVLHDADEIAELPAKLQLVDPAKVHGARVGYLRFRCRDSYVGVWFIDRSSADGEGLRKLRIGLGRLHAERQATLAVLRATQAGVLARSEALGDFLTARLGLLAEPHKFGIDQQAIREITSVYDAALPEEERGLLEERVGEVRAGLGEKVRRFVVGPASPRRAGIFVSYSHADAAIQQRLARVLKLLPNVRYWDDTMIEPGAVSVEEIHKAMAASRVAVLLLSVDFFSSSFLQQEELPPLLQAHEAGELMLFPVFVRHISEHMLGALQGAKGINTPERPLSRMSEAEQEEVLVQLYDAIHEALGIESAPAQQS